MLNKSFPCKQDVEDRGHTVAAVAAGVERGFYLPNKVPLFCGSSSILSSEQQLPPPLCKSLVYIAKRKVKATIGTVPLSPMHEKRGEPGRNGLLQSYSFKIEHQIEEDALEKHLRMAPLQLMEMEFQALPLKG